MTAQRLPTGTDEERETALSSATIAVQKGQLVVLPTDTVYGIGADAFDATAVGDLLAAKGRGRDMPVPVLVGSWATIEGLSSSVSTTTWSLVEKFWPGGLTIIVEQAPSLTWDLGDARGTVAIRMPLHPVAIELLERYRPPGRTHLFGMPRDPARRLTTNAVEQRIPRLARAAGIVELLVTPHVLRHTFGSLMLLADPTALVPTRDLMGHESVETTNKYAHTREAERRLALASMHELRRRGR